MELKLGGVDLAQWGMPKIYAKCLDGGGEVLTATDTGQR
jgi:hypothetical protein